MALDFGDADGILLLRLLQQNHTVAKQYQAIL